MSLELLWERDDLPQHPLPEELRSLYDGLLGFDEPCVYANFVETVDGVVAIPAVEGSNAIVASESADDKFVIGLLRAFADVVLVGAATLRASQKGRWRPAGPHPQGERAFAELRAARGRPEHPAVAVVTTGATLDLDHRVLDEALVLTTASGAAKLDGVVPNVVAVNDGDAVDLGAAVELLHDRGYSLVLAEAGPTTFAQLVQQGLVDELFLTVSPLLAGRIATGHRLGLVEGVELLPDSACRPTAAVAAPRAGAPLPPLFLSLRHERLSSNGAHRQPRRAAVGDLRVHVQASAAPDRRKRRRRLLRRAFDFVLALVRAATSDEWTVEAISWAPYRLDHRWSTTREFRGQVLAQVEGQLARGETPHPRNARDR